jgi:hypothetical protein
VKNESKSKGFLTQAAYAHQELPGIDERRFLSTYGVIAAKMLSPQ